MAETFDATRQVRVLTGQGGPPAGTECCVVRGRPWLRSVHRERAGRVMEPRKSILAESTRSVERKTPTPVPKGPGAGAPPGSGSGACAQGSPKPGRSRLLHRGRSGAGAAQNGPGPRGVRPALGERRGAQAVVLPSGGDEASAEPVHRGPPVAAVIMESACWRGLPAFALVPARSSLGGGVFGSPPPRSVDPVFAPDRLHQRREGDGQGAMPHPAAPSPSPR